MAAAAVTQKLHAKEHLPRRRSVSQICPPPRRPMTLAEVYPGCENERLGVVRESMLQNHLINKTELGKSRRSCYTLPGYDFNYGLYLHGTDGGVPEAIGHWNAIKPRAPSAKDRGRDYKTMNRKAIQEGYVTAHEQNLYRQLKDIRLNDNDERRFKKTPPKVPPDMTYGRPARPSTPFFDLLQQKYKEIWMEQQRAVIRAQKEEKKQKKTQRESVRNIHKSTPEVPASDEDGAALAHTPLSEGQSTSLHLPGPGCTEEGLGSLPLRNPCEMRPPGNGDLYRCLN